MSRPGMLAFALFMASGIVVSERVPGGESAAAPTFYRDILPILQQHCQKLSSPRRNRSHAAGHLRATRTVGALRWPMTPRSKRMPPWFADPCCGHFADDPSLTEAQIATLSAWARDESAAATHRTPRHLHTGQKAGTFANPTSL